MSFLYALSLLAAVTLPSDTGWCEIECSQCPSNSINVKVEQVAGTTSKVTIDNCAPAPGGGFCTQTQQWVPSASDETVEGQCNNGCKVSAKPCAGKQWKDVDDCEDVCATCRAC